MARANLKHLVEDADFRVQRSLRCLDRQREAVSALEQTNRDATTTKRLLAISKNAFEIHVADRFAQGAGSAVARSQDIKDRQDEPARVKSDSLERLAGPGVPTYQPRTKSIPRVEKRP